MTTLIILIVGLVLLNAAFITAILLLNRRHSGIPDDDAEWYDEEGNHLYYDRKLIARLKRERAAEKNSH